MSPFSIQTLDELAGLVGRELVSDWLSVDQDRIDRFAETTGDRQWLHLDVDRARRESPYGTTVAHGFLTLSLVSALLRDALALGGAVGSALNYGLDRVRFPSPVPAGARIRGRFRLERFGDAAGGREAVWAVTLEREGADKPCCVAEWTVRYAPAAAANPRAEWIDGPQAVRPGEELDLARLAPYLREILGRPGARVEVEQFRGGHSNLTYLVRVDGREAVLRRPPFGSTVKSAHDMGREFRILSRLAPAYARAPKVIAFCEDESILGAPFYLMERVRGVILRRQPAPGLVLDERAARRLSEAAIDGLADLHAVDPRAVGLGDLGKPEGYCQRQVSGWTRRYRDAQTDDIPDMEAVAAWLAANLPPDGPGCLIHNDYKYDNLVLDPADLTRIVGVLDWEMSTLGDPLMDLGTTLCYWVEAADPEPLRATAFGPTAAPGSLTRAELVERYADRTGRSVSDITFYYGFGLFKTAVVAQQIYSRYRQGLTRDERFARLIESVRLLAGQAQRQSSTARDRSTGWSSRGGSSADPAGS
ncbi:MAG TPA: phosphotransferase [Vicinamibacteria bacterium]|nr:phosphotransferase [Vicinamibacteria bacterium]